MTIRNSLIAAVAAAAFAGTTALAAAQGTVTLYNGATINARMNQSLSSSSANVGDTFTMTVVPPYPSGNPAFQGATISGVVTQAQRAGQGRPAQLEMKLQYLRLSNGAVANISGAITSTQKTNNTANTVGKSALGAIGGMLIGNAIGQMIFHSSGGGPAGFIAGGLLGANNKNDFTIAQGSTVTLQLSRDVTIRRQARPPQ